MSYSAKILEKLYNAEKITAYGLRKAVEDEIGRAHV